MEDLTGLKVNDLTVKSFVGMDKYRTSIWKCKCVCGNYTNLRRTNLLGKRPSKSCGHCLDNEIGRKRSFLEKVKKSKNGGCWEWQACKCSLGYGNFWNGTKLVSAHRFSYEIYVGNIPEGLFVCHTCDNPGCVNPAHLFLGTQQDNVQDMYNKNRQPYLKGEKNPNCKITEDTAKAILKELNGKRKGYKKIAKKFKVSVGVVAKISIGKTWKHLNKDHI